MSITQNMMVDKTNITVTSLQGTSDEKTYWLSRTHRERLQHIEILRRINHGHRAAARLQRILEVAKR